MSQRQSSEVGGNQAVSPILNPSDDLFMNLLGHVFSLVLGRRPRDFIQAVFKRVVYRL